MNCDLHAECNGAAWLSEPVAMGDGWPFANCFLKQLADACELPSDPFTGPEVERVTLSLKCDPTAADATLKAPMCAEVEEFEAALAPEAMGPIAEGPLGGTREFPAPGGAEAPGGVDLGDGGDAPGVAPESAEGAAPGAIGKAVAAVIASCAAALVVVAAV